MSEDHAVEADVWTIGRLLQWTTGHLARRGIEDARLASEVLLAHTAGCRRIDLYTRFDRPLAGEPLDRFREWVRRAADQEPIAYLVGEKEFYSRAFRVTPDVLIPRPETELLVEAVIDHCHGRRLKAPPILDLGTGSGCLAVTCLLELPDSTAVAVDVSAAALRVACENATRHGVAARCTFVTADRLNVPAEFVPEGGFDVLVSNPPYVPDGAGSQVDPSVRRFEPRMAWTDGADGLSFYRTMAADGPRFLSTGSAVFVEIGDGQARAVTEIFASSRAFRHERTYRDRSVGAERVLMFARVA
jgi:release factor glutamine methyltransferase